MDNMNKMKIRLNATADVREFVRAAEKCDFDVDTDSRPPRPREWRGPR